MVGLTSVTEVTCTLPVSNGTSATWTRSACSVTMSAAEPPSMFAKATFSTESDGDGSTLRPMSPSSLSSRPVASRAAAWISGL